MTFLNLLSAIGALSCLPLALAIFSLSRKVKNLNNLEEGLGGAIAVLNQEVERLDLSIRAARREALQASRALDESVKMARDEKAFWLVQKQLMNEGELKATRRLKRRRGKPEVQDA